MARHLGRGGESSTGDLNKDMGIWSRIKNTFHSGGRTSEIQEELQFHLDMDVADGRDTREARIRLGNLTRLEEETRAMGIIEWFDSVIQDARYAVRQLRKTPALASAVALSLMIGVGANTAIFDLVDAAILRPLPVKDPDSLRIVEWTNDGFPVGVNNINGDFRPISGGRAKGSSVAAYLYRRLAREQTSFQALIGVADPDAVAIAVDASPAEQVHLQYVSSNFFQGLGIAPVIGRPFGEEEDRVGQEPVVIVSHRFWLRRLGGSSETLERNIRINNTPARIVGVAPPGFFGLMTGQWTDVYAPLADKVAFSPRPNGAAQRGEDDSDWWVRQMARIRPGVQESIARAEIAALFRGMAVPDSAQVAPNKIPELVTSPGRRGFDALNPRDANALWILMLLVGVLLLIVCANVANLLLARSVRRQRESAVRLALGAPRSRLFRQHLIESGVLALIGGGAGLASGYVLARSIHVVFQAGRDASSAFDLHLDVRVLGYTAAVSMLAALLFSLAPAVRAIHSDAGDVLKAQTRSVMGSRLQFPTILVSIQIALSLTALFAAGLLGRSLEKLKWQDLGFNRENLAYASVNPSHAGYTAERVGPFVNRVREEIARLPGVQKVSTTSFRPLSGMGNNGGLNFAGRPYSLENRANLSSVGDEFFETLRIPLLAGRAIEPRDIHPNAEAVVVDDLFARRFFPNESPLGHRFGLGPGENNRYEIVGVVRNSAYNLLRADPVPTFYEAFVPGMGTIHFAIRTTMDSTRLAEAVRRAVASVDPAVPVSEFRTQTALIDRMLRTERLLGFLSAAFGLVALTLAAIGLGGLLAYVVARRTSEIGVRMALGAAAGDVVRMVLRDAMRMVGSGILIGLPCAYGVGRIMKNALFRLEPLDPATAAVSFFALLAAALMAAWIPARRAAGIDPMRALREE
jgi:predicted permease